MSDDAKPAEDEKAPEEEAAKDGEESEEGDASEEGGEDEEEAPSGLKAKLAGKMMYIIISVVVLILGGGGAGLYFAGVFTKEKLHETTVMLPGPPVYYEMQKITVDLKPSAKRARPFIRLVMQVELQGESAKAAFIEHEAKVLDGMQAHLRTVQPEELSGKQGTERLREDFVLIINRVIKPERAITIFYKEILVR